MSSPVDLCNQALDQIGVTVTIQGINPPVPPNATAAQVASRTYGTQTNAIFRAANWNCARLEAPLSLLKAAKGTPENPSGSLPMPPVPWLYEYAYPSDCIKMRFVIPNPFCGTAGSGGAPFMTNLGGNQYPLVSTAMPFVPAIDKDASGNQIRVMLTNAEQAIGVYTGRIDNTDLWDPLLIDAVIAALAAWFVNPLARNDKLLVERTQIAAGILTQARIADGNEGITSVDHMPDWLTVRSAGGWGAFGERNGLGGAYLGGWDSWSGPNGVSY